MLRFLSVFDWISPVKAYVEDVLYGPGGTFVVAWPFHLSAHQLRRYLAAHGVKTWGWLVVNDHLMFTVREKQLRWAWYLLQRQRVPVVFLPPQLRGNDAL